MIAWRRALTDKHPLPVFDYVILRIDGTLYMPSEVEVSMQCTMQVLKMMTIKTFCHTAEQLIMKGDAISNGSHTHYVTVG